MNYRRTGGATATPLAVITISKSVVAAKSSSSTPSFSEDCTQMPVDADELISTDGSFLAFRTVICTVVLRLIVSFRTRVAAGAQSPGNGTSDFGRRHWAHMCQNIIVLHAQCSPATNEAAGETSGDPRPPIPRRGGIVPLPSNDDRWLCGQGAWIENSASAYRRVYLHARATKAPAPCATAVAPVLPATTATQFAPVASPLRRMAFVNPTPLASRTTFATRSTAPARAPRRNVTRMIATEPKAPTKLSNRAAQLLSYVRGHKSIFRPGRGFNSTTVTLFRKNDTGRSFTPLDELATNARMLPAGSVAATMLVQEEDLLAMALEVGVARASALESDEVVKEIYMHDIRYLLRVISYGAACQSSDFIHTNNMGMMKMLHEEVGLPAGLVAKAITAVKEAVLGQVTDASLIESTSECFDVVSAFMS